MRPPPTGYSSRTHRWYAPHIHCYRMSYTRMDVGTPIHPVCKSAPTQSHPATMTDPPHTAGMATRTTPYHWYDHPLRRSEQIR